MKTAALEYRDGDVTCRGFLSYDGAHGGKHPGVQVVHEAFGLGAHAVDRAKMLGELGYVALAADLYGGRKRAVTMEEIGALMGNLRENQKRLRARARAALDTLTKLPQVGAMRMAANGFCLGGTTVLELARDGAPLKGVVSFHGNLTTKAPAQKSEVKASVLVCSGAHDPTIPPEQIVAFEEEMHEAGTDWQTINFGRTVHSFTNLAADGAFLPYTIYNKRTDTRAWKAMCAFFD